MKSFRIFLIPLFLILVSGDVLANGTGIIGRTASNLGCLGSGCHASSATPSTSVTFTSSSGSFTVAPNGSLEITVIVAHPTQSAAGFDAAIKTTQNGSTNVGTMVATTSDTRVVNGEITHTTPKSMTNGKTEFTFTWTAPSAEGTYFLRAVGNAVNNNSISDVGDLWNFATPIQITVKQASGVEKSEINPITVEVFPNPTSEYATIKYDVSNFSNGTIEVTDIIGRSFSKQTLVNSSGNLTIPLQSFPIGLYRIQVRAGNRGYFHPLVISR